MKKTFLPESWIPSQPEFIVWFTGTLGQAEWLISHSNSLRGKSIPKKWPKTSTKKNAQIDISQLPERMRPMMALEQPDLVIADVDGNPLMSIEITEQQDFGSNGQQRMARFWSAVSNKIPCAYLLPIESYQIEKENSSQVIQAFNEPKSIERTMRLLQAQLPNSNIDDFTKYNVKSSDDLKNLLKQNKMDHKNKSEFSLYQYVFKFLNDEDKNGHLQLVDTDEYIHNIEDQYYKIYIRKPEIPGSMLLRWFEICSKNSPANVFKLQSSYQMLFRSNGLVHTIQDEKYPHLSYRNLPPSPGQTGIVSSRVRKDEISLFFDFLDAVISKQEIPDLGREIFTTDNNYYEASIENEWAVRIDKTEDFLARNSATFLLSKQILFESLKISGIEASNESLALLYEYEDFCIYKVLCRVARDMSDPYSGGMAVRDILLTRDNTNISQGRLVDFNRTRGLVFWLELQKSGAEMNRFIVPSIDDNYKRLFPHGTAKNSQDKVIELINNARAEEISKNIRNAIVFSDLIFVRRTFAKNTKTEIIAGLPSLIRTGIVNQSASLVKSLSL